MATTADSSILQGQERALGWWAHLPQLRDPGHASLRRALRAAVLVPLLFAILSRLLPQPQLITFAIFGVFALSVMGDFGGTSRPRASAYALSTLIGSVLITLGTLVSGNPWAAAGVVFVVGFAVQFVGVFGGYVTAAQLPLLLSLILSVAIQAPVDQLPMRLIGWTLGGSVALVGGVWLWPRHEQATLRKAAAEACDALADLVRARYVSHVPADELDSRRQRAQRATDALGQVYFITPWRPASPAPQDRAFAELVDEIGRELKVFMTFGQADQPEPPDVPAVDELGLATAEVLQASARVLKGSGPAPDLARLAQAREQQRESMDNWAATELRSGAPASRVFDGLESRRSARIVSYVALALGANATLAAGFDLDLEGVTIPREVDAGSGLATGLRRVMNGLRTHFRPSSIWWRNSLRGAVGLAVAVLLVELIGLDHAFWAVLGTMSVLRSSALATGRTAAAAVLGTTLGILPVGLLLIPLGADPTLLWLVFPPAVFLAAYAPSVIGFVVGQAAFTLLVVVLFNLIQPVGWTLGLVRLQDVLVGAAVSLLVGALMWPRGARGQLRTALGARYRTDAAYLRTAFRFVLGETSSETCLARRQAAVGEAARAGEVFDQFLHDRSAKILPPATWGALQAGGSSVLLAADSLERMANHGTQVTACGSSASVLSGQVEVLMQQFERLADGLQAGHPPVLGPGVVGSERDLAQAAMACLGEWGGADDGARRASALGMVAAGDWVRYLGMLGEHLSGPAAAAVRVANLPWWH